MIPGINGIHHVAISVDDLDRAEAFYCKTLGFEVVERYDFEPSDLGDRITGLTNAAARSLMIAAGNVYLEVFEFLSPEPAGYDGDRPVCDLGYTHLALDVDPAHIDAIYTELGNAGVRWHHPPCDETGDNLTMTYGRDPFGNVIELQALKPGCRFHGDRLRSLTAPQSRGGS